MTEEELFAQLEEDLGEIEEPEIVDVTQLSILELLALRRKIDTILRSRSQYVFPTTAWGRDKHSLRAAVVVELNKRANGT